MFMECITAYGQQFQKQQFTKLKFYLRDITCAERRCEMIQFGYKGIMFGKAESP